LRIHDIAELADGLMSRKNAPAAIHVFLFQIRMPRQRFTIDEIEPRLFSFNTRMARARPATGLARNCISIPIWWCRIKPHASPMKRSRRGRRLHADP